ncbi:substrate-binding domain-containing protein [Amycolatopsis sp. NPDC049252]|uniref:substrate-binding domain-containing protein n=1 Tax=Amycolatopsis sp. NPDC049252 TaxID=3363933 RepID=UPI00371A5180
MANAVRTAAGSFGYSTVRSTFGVDGSAGAALLGLSRRTSIDAAAVIAAPSADRFDYERMADKLPLVVVGGADCEVVPVVATDDRAAAGRVTEHLLEEGAANVWHVAGPETSFEAREREGGWRSALGRHRAPAPPVLRGDWTVRSGYVLGQVLAHESGLDAIFVANDSMALGILRALVEAGLRVPRDVRLAGFGDLPDAEYYSAPLTTVRQDHSGLGTLAIEVLEGIRGTLELPWRRTIPAKLVVRESSQR